MATLSLASWAVALKREHLPSEIVHAAVQSFYNWAGCTIHGSNQEAVEIALEALTPLFGINSSCLLGHRGRVRADAERAALINGIASHVDDYDDTHPKSKIHPSGPVCSALLAYAEWKQPVSGSDFIVAMVAGIEAECKLGLAVVPTHYEVGWHITGTAGSIGAAVAVGKLMGLEVPAMQHAIGLAATQVVGLRAVFGSHTKSFHPGRAAQNGLLSAMLAAKGYTSSLQGLEAKRGWANVVSKSHNLPAHFDALGKTWEIKQNAFKPFPCGLVVHSVIDASIQLHHELAKLGIFASEITAVTAQVHAIVLELTANPEPKDELQSKFSVFHAGAVGLVRGKAGIEEFSDAAANDPVLVELRRKINVVMDPALEEDETVVKVALKDGRQIEKHVVHAVGSLHVPLTDHQLEKKFKEQSFMIWKDQKAVDRASQACWALEGCADVKTIAELL